MRLRLAAQTFRSQPLHMGVMKVTGTRNHLLDGVVWAEFALRFSFERRTGVGFEAFGLAGVPSIVDDLLETQ